MQSETRLLGSSILRFLYHLRRRRWPRKLVKIHFCLFVWFLCQKQQKTRPIEKYVRILNDDSAFGILFHRARGLGNRVF